MSKASAHKDKLTALHAAVADALAADLLSYTNGSRDEEDPETGKVVKAAVPPQLYAQIIKFLKDNNIEASEDNPAMRALTAAFNATQFPYNPNEVQ